MRRINRKPVAEVEKDIEAAADELRDKLAERVDKVSSGDEWQTRNLSKLAERIRKGKR